MKKHPRSAGPSPTPLEAGRSAVAATVLLALAGCGGTGRSPPADTASPEPPVVITPAGASVTEAAARADSVRRHYNRADVDFMTGMIHHHAQALDMCAMAPSHGARDPLLTLCARIVNAQKDEIHLMQRWLRERGEAVPEVEMGDAAAGDGAGVHDAHGSHDRELMAGMLSPRQMARLDAARGPEWDRLFLTYMIQHHQGALTMVEELFGTYGAGQGDAIFKIASDIGADQASEIDRMQRMLEALLFGAGGLP